MNSRRIFHEVVSRGIDSEAQALAIRNLEVAKARRTSAVLCRYLTSQRVEEFLEALFALLSLVYCVAAAGFAGILLGNAIGS
ncbi:MAG TPA: hypothetical protein VE860_03770 [Chthoniobacterales bacterium]|jgi:hypothetical protein|nr:hypothetical protein [Chthoniobacterales bacterium]